MSTVKKLFLSVPEEAWDTLEKTLALDSESSAFDPDLRNEIKKALGKVERHEIHKFVLTAYLDSGDDLQFYAGPAGDFDREVASNGSVRVLKEFVIHGNIVEERGETEPIRVRPPF